MEYTIGAAHMPPINFAPATKAEEILQNIRCILVTMKFSVPLDRDFGIDSSFLDAPMEMAKAKMITEIVTAINKYEPRASVTQIDWEHDIDGILRPKVQVRIDDEA